MRDISIDIETLASGTNAALAQIGACYRKDDGELEKFFIAIDDPTGVYSPGTIRWHVEQGGVGLVDGPEQVGYFHVSDALIEFGRWLRRAGAHKEGGALLWTHATFDIPRLADAMARNGFTGPPWHYRNCRDLRTLYDLAGGRPQLERVGSHHNALDDAVYQLGEIESCMRVLTDGHGITRGN